MGAGYGGYGGFEKENLRQSSLAGRKYREFDKSARLTYFHQNNIHNDGYGDHQPHVAADSLSAVTAYTTRGASQAHTPNHRYVTPRVRPLVVGEKSNYGVSVPGFNIINGESEVAMGTGPHFGYFGAKRPVHGLGVHQQDTIFKASSMKDTTKFPPSANTAGVGEVMRQYTNAAQALKPPGQTPMDNFKPMAKEYLAYGEMQNEFSRQKRPMAAPQDRFENPVTSSQCYGWNTTSLPKFEPLHGIKMCRETRRAQSLIIGARHSNGYAGQGSL